MNKLKKTFNAIANYFKSIWKVLPVIGKAVLKFPIKILFAYKKSSWQYRALSILFGIYLILGVFLTIAIFGLNKDTEQSRNFLKIYPLPAAIVNYQPIFLKDFYRQKSYVQSYAGKSGQEMPTDEYVLGQMIDLKLISQQAKKSRISLSDNEFEEVYDKKIEEAGGKETIVGMLQEYYGMSEPEFKKLMRDNLLREKLGKELPVQVKARHILIKDEKVANEILERIKSGEVFEDLAKQYSEDVASRDNGGDLGWFGKGVMVEDFERAVFDAGKGALIPELIKSEFGFHIIRVDERKGVIDKSFDNWFKELKEKSRIWRFIF